MGDFSVKFCKIFKILVPKDRYFHELYDRDDIRMATGQGVHLEHVKANLTYSIFYRILHMDGWVQRQRIESSKIQNF